MILDDNWIEARLALHSYNVMTSSSSSEKIPAGGFDKQSGLPFGETIELHRSKYREMAEALKSIPAEMKSAYSQALEKCPKLVETESDPIMFLRREGFHGISAALRLTGYWKARKKAFGEDRAFLPLHDTVSGKGALNLEADIPALRTGFRYILPDHNDGYPVRKILHLAHETRLKVAF